MSEQEKQYKTAYYVGKEFVRKFEGKEGKEGFKTYKLAFKEDLDQQFAFKVGFADFVKGFDDLEEGEQYVVGYNLSEPIYNDKAKKEIRYKNGFFLKKADEEDLKNKEATKTSTKPATPAPKLEDLQSFVQAYKLNCERYGREPSVADCVKQYFFNNYEELWKELETVAVQELALSEQE